MLLATAARRAVRRQQALTLCVSMTSDHCLRGLAMSYCGSGEWKQPLMHFHPGVLQCRNDRAQARKVSVSRTTLSGAQATVQGWHGVPLFFPANAVTSDDVVAVREHPGFSVDEGAFFLR
jgi:hypothetical protein